MLILSSNMILLSFASPAGIISVDPTPIEFSTDPAEPNYRAVGDNFTVDIMAADFVEPGIYAYELKLIYDNTILECIAWELPEGHFLTPAEGEMPIGIVPNVYDVAGNHESGYALGAFYLQGDAAGKTGSGVLVTFTFEITQAPSAAGVLSCDLVLGDVIFADPDINDVEVTPEHGYYEFSPPRPSVYLSVEPSMVGAAEVGDDVIIDIMINDVEEEIKLIGVQWKLHYNTTLLEATRILIAEGDFMKSFGRTYFWAAVEDDYTISFTILLPEEGEPWPPLTFPKGSGTLATIRFTATYKPETGKATCDLLLDEEFVMLLDLEENEIPVHHLEHGTYFIPVKPGDLNFDGKVDILDIGTFAKAYGSYPGHPRWNPLADMNRDKVINILDVVTIAKNFGK